MIVVVRSLDILPARDGEFGIGMLQRLQDADDLGVRQVAEGGRNGRADGAGSAGYETGSPRLAGNGVGWRWTVAGSGEHIKALVRSHAGGDDDAFYAVALQVAAQAARQGHHRLASELKGAVDDSRRVRSTRVTSIAQPRGDLADLVIASHPTVGLKDLVLPAQLEAHVTRVLAEQRQRKHLLDHGFEPVHRLLFEGPPGTGKTMTAAVLAHELALPLLTVRLDSLLSKFMGESAAKLRVIFEGVEEQRAVYLFDEFDALAGYVAPAEGQAATPAPEKS